MWCNLNNVNADSASYSDLQAICTFHACSAWTSAYFSVLICSFIHWSFSLFEHTCKSMHFVFFNAMLLNPLLLRQYISASRFFTSASKQISSCFFTVCWWVCNIPPVIKSGRWNYIVKTKLSIQLKERLEYL